jgi:predicted RNase H-like HicB family nuclease
LNYFNYFSEIEETFNRRRGKYLFLSPLDWALIESWQERGVPLHVVLRGIEKVFDGVDGAPTKRKRSVKSLTYCREEIEAQYEEWLERQIGKNGADSSDAAHENNPFAADALKAHLENAAAELTFAAEKATGELRDVLERAVARMAELKNSFADAESLEAALEDLEKMIDAALLESATAEIEARKTEIGKQMAHYRGKMEQEVFDRTFDLMLLKKLREQVGIPRISLFYL